MSTELSEDDEGKTVVTQDDERLGTVYDVEYSVVQVAAESDIDDARKLETREQDAIYELEEREVTEVTDTEVRVDRSR